MKSTLLIYTSKTGFTKKYAEWISESVNCQTISLDKINNIEIKNYSIIIYGAGIRAGRIQELAKFKNKFLYNKEAEQKLIVFATGGAPDNKNIVAKIMENNFSEDELKRVSFFYFQSGLNYHKMPISGRIMMNIYKFFLRFKKNKSATENGTSKTISKSYDYSNIERIKPLIDYLSSLNI